MPRSGRFGRLPRRAPDLSGALVAMMREFWSTQESVMVNAWREGGEVDGKPVTDERILQFWQDRRDSVSTDDPLWSYYNNQHQQYDFAIRESEVGLKYAQHKMSAREVARWYRGEAQKYVRDSEIYRTIAGQAAKFLDAARNQAKADTSDRRGKAYVKTWEATYKDNLLPSVYVTTGLTRVFREYGLLVGSQNQTPPVDGEAPALGEGADLTDLSFQAGSQQSWETILGVINDPASPVHDWFQKNYIDPAARDGLQVDLPFNQQDLEALMARSMAGYDKLIAVNKKFDDVAPKTGAASTDGLRKDQLGALDTFQFLFTLDEVALYSQRRRTFESVVNDPTASVFEKASALANYYKGLGGLATQVGDQNPVMTTALEVERRYLMGDSVGAAPTVAEDALLTPFGASTPLAGNDAGVWSGLSRNLSETIEALTSGKAVAVMTNKDGTYSALTPAQLQAQYGHDYIIVPRIGNAPSWSPSENAGDRLLGKGAQITSAGQITYGEVFETHAITAKAPLNPTPDATTGDILGDELTPTGSTDIGMVAYLPDANGFPTVPVYGIKGDGGKVRWTVDSPFMPGSVLPGGAQADPSGALTVWLDPAAQNVGLVDAEGKPAFNPQGAVDLSLFNPGSTSSFVDPGLAALAATPSGRHQIAQMNPDELLVTLGSSPWVDWQDQNDVSELWNDVSAIKSADAGGGASGYAAQYRFYQQLAQGRQPGVSNAWTLVKPDEMGAEQYREDFRNAGLAAAGAPKPPMEWTAMPPERPVPLGLPGGAAAGLLPGYRPPQYQPGLGNTGTAGMPGSPTQWPGSSQPQINLNSQISVPSLPAGSVPTPAPGLGSTPAPTPAPTPRPTPVPTYAPKPPSSYVPSIPGTGWSSTPGSHPGGGGQ